MRYKWAQRCSSVHSAAALMLMRRQWLIFDLWHFGFEQDHSTHHANSCQKTTSYEHHVQVQVPDHWKDDKQTGLRTYPGIISTDEKKTKWTAAFIPVDSLLSAALRRRRGPWETKWLADSITVSLLLRRWLVCVGSTHPLEHLVLLFPASHIMSEQLM